ncbi:MAG: succinate dehydrogenase assembly factor 2 [Maricaulaceae bacterium]
MDARRKRLLYRANYRGFKEADLLLGGFAKKYMENLTEEEVVQFEELLHAKDHDIYDWIAGRAEAPAVFDTPILARLKTFRPNE